MKITIPFTFNLNKKDLKALRAIQSGEYSVMQGILDKLTKLKLIKINKSFMYHNLYSITRQGKMILNRLDSSNRRDNYYDFTFRHLKDLAQDAFYPPLKSTILI